jgi:hypothetical protein
MTRTTPIRLRIAAITAAIFFASLSFAQAPPVSRYLGSITAINGNTLTVKTDTGESHQVTVPDGAALKRIEPGQKDLSSAAAISFSDLAVGDRVLVRLDPATVSANPPSAQQIIAIKAADVAQKQEQEREDWQKRGIAGLVKSVDAASGTIAITTGAGPTAKTVTVKIAAATVLKRYAPASVRFDQALPAPIDAIRAGDQLRACGEKSADGSTIAAEEVVSGTFRNLSGTVAAIDPAASTISIKDLATKKSYTIHIGPDAQMHRLPEQMAQVIAARLKGTAPAGAQRTAGSGSSGSGSSGAGRTAGGGGGGGQGGDPGQFLARTPAIQITDLQKGQAVMVVAADGTGNNAGNNTGDVNAVTLLAGVEPLLEAPAARDLLSSWSMGGGEGAAAGTQ